MRILLHCKELAVVCQRSRIGHRTEVGLVQVLHAGIIGVRIAVLAIKLTACLEVIKEARRLDPATPKIYYPVVDPNMEI